MSELKYTVGQMNNIMSSSLEYFTNWKEAEKENKRLTARIAELEAENAGLKERVAMLDVTAVFKSLGEMGYIEQTDKLHTRIAELEAYIDQLIEAGSDLALIAKDIFEFDGESGEFTPIAEKWQALVKDWKEREE